MAYISEALACRRIKDPVKFYLYTIAEGEYEAIGREFSESLAGKLMESGRAYLASLSAFADSGGVTYAKEEQSEEEKAHERWHTHLIGRGLVSDAGDFIEEASAAVIESVLGGLTGECLGISRKFIELHRKVQKSTDGELERLLERHFVGRKEMIYEEGKQIMEGSCPWLSYISQAQYFLLYGLCLGVYQENGNSLRKARNVFKESLYKARDEGVNAGLGYLRQRTTPSMAELYGFDLSDIGEYFPSCPESHARGYNFVGKGLKIEIYFENKSWLEIVEGEIRTRGFK